MFRKRWKVERCDRGQARAVDISHVPTAQEDVYNVRMRMMGLQTVRVLFTSVLARQEASFCRLHIR